MSSVCFDRRVSQVYQRNIRGLNKLHLVWTCGPSDLSLKGCRRLVRRLLKCSEWLLRHCFVKQDEFRAHLGYFRSDPGRFSAQVFLLFLDLWVRFRPEVIWHDLMAEHRHSLLCQFLRSNKRLHLKIKRPVLAGYGVIITKVTLWKRSPPALHLDQETAAGGWWPVTCMMGSSHFSTACWWCSAAQTQGRNYPAQRACIQNISVNIAKMWSLLGKMCSSYSPREPLILIFQFINETLQGTFQMSHSSDQRLHRRLQLLLLPLLLK